MLCGSVPILNDSNMFVNGFETCTFKYKLAVKKLTGPLAWLDAHQPGIQMVLGSILQSGETFFLGDWS